MLDKGFLGILSLVGIQLDAGGNYMLISSIVEIGSGVMSYVKISGGINCIAIGILREATNGTVKLLCYYNNKRYQ